MSWVLIWLVFFSVCETKLPNYLVPAYPALAIIGGGWVADWIAIPARRTAPAGCRCNGLRWRWSV